MLNGECMKTDKIKVTRYVSSKEAYPETEEKPKKPPLYFVALINIIIPKWADFFIEDIKVFQKNGHYWIKFPERSEKNEQSGEIKYFPRSGFHSKDIHEKFEKQVLSAIDDYVKKNQNIGNSSDEVKEEAPF